jgi:hypothetical protein
VTSGNRNSGCHRIVYRVDVGCGIWPRVSSSVPSTSTPINWIMVDIR